MVDHDRLFKELIQTFFWEFLDLFLPEVGDYVNRDRLTFLPEEIFVDVTAGEKRRVDLLAQVEWLGEERFFLIHIENQAYSQKDFARRMFHYFARLDAKYGLPIYPVVIFSYDRPQGLAPDQYRVDFPDRAVLDFRFRTIQLNRLPWRDFLNQRNPIAAALMAKMQFKPEERIRVKLECLRLLATLQLNPAKMELISGFVDSYIRLNAQENELFNDQLQELEGQEQEQVMKIVTSWMEQGLEEGLERGLEQGLERGLRQAYDRQWQLIESIAKKRFGEQAKEVMGHCDGLSMEQLEQFVLALFDLTTAEEAIAWLDRAILENRLEA